MNIKSKIYRRTIYDANNYQEYQCKSIPSSFNDEWGRHSSRTMLLKVYTYHISTSTSDSNKVLSPKSKRQKKMITTRIPSRRNVVFVINTVQ